MTSARAVAIRGGLAGLTAVLLCAACTTDTLNYCDANTPCTAPGSVCDVPAKTCVPRADPDGSVDGQKPTPDAQKPSPDAIVDAPAKLLKDGEACGAPSHCESGFCADSVCCANACEGACSSCALAGSTGQCKPAIEGTDPHGDCAGSDKDCAGSCDGSGGCTFPQEGKTCGVTSCAAGQLDKGACDDKGACARTKQGCGGYACSNADSCRTSCDDPTHCVSPAACDTTAKICKAQQANGAACGSNSDLCKSGYCVDTVCCATASCLECNSCKGTGAAGSCSPVADGVTCGKGTTCTGSSKTVDACKTGACKPTSTHCAPFACNGAGHACGISCGDDTACTATAFCNTVTSKCQPKKGNGLTCGAGNECTSGTCTTKENVCCNTLCGGDCETCAGQSACSPKPKDTLCGAADQCTNGTLTSFIDKNRCAGTTTTCVNEKFPCDPYKCGGGATCRTSCTTHAQCSSGLCQLWETATRNTCVLASQICYVKAGSNGAGTQAAPAGTISACLAKGIIVVADGTYAEDLVFKRKTLLVGTATPLSLGTPQDPAKVKVFIAPTNKGVTFTTQSEVRIVGVQFKASVGLLMTGKNLTLRIHTSVFADSSAACLVTTNSDVLLDEVFLTNCNGPAVRHEAGTLELRKVSVAFNQGPAIHFESGTLKARDLRVDLSQKGIQTFAATLDLDRVFLYGNTLGGMTLEASTTGTIYNLVAAANAKEAIRLDASSFVTISSSTIANNNGIGGDVTCGTTETRIWNSVIWDPSGPITSGKCTPIYSDVSTAVPNMGNISLDPKFAGATQIPPNLSLAANSPCIDAGKDTVVSPGPTVDFLGNPRYFDAISGGQKIDMGAYERQTP